MKRRLWRVLRKLAPIFTFLYAAHIILPYLENFWEKALFRHIQIPLSGPLPTVFYQLVIMVLTVAGLLVADFILELRWIKVIFNTLARSSQILGYFWSEEENGQSVPIIFRFPEDGMYKFGFVMGEQKMDDGREFYRVFVIPAVGDQQLIEKGKPDLMIPLDNPPAEIVKLVSSFMTSGPEYLRRKKVP